MSVPGLSSSSPSPLLPIARVNGRLPTLAFGIKWTATVAKTETEAAYRLLADPMTVADFSGADSNPFFVQPAERRGSFVDLQAVVVALRAGGAYLAHVDGDELNALDGALGHTGDDKAGLGSGWGEVGTINLGFLPEEADSVALFVHSKSGHPLSAAKEGGCAVFSMRDQAVFLDLPLKEMAATTCLAALFRRHGTEMALQPVGLPFNATSVDKALSVIPRFL